MALQSDIPDSVTPYVHPTTKQCNYSVSIINNLTSSSTSAALSANQGRLLNQKIAELEDLKTSVSNGKTLLANAITDKGVATSSSDTFATMAANIAKLKIVPPEPVLIENKNFYANITELEDTYGSIYYYEIDINNCDYIIASIRNASPSEQRCNPGEMVSFGMSGDTYEIYMFENADQSVTISIIGYSYKDDLGDNIYIYDAPRNMRPYVMLELYKNS